MLLDSGPSIPRTTRPHRGDPGRRCDDRRRRTAGHIDHGKTTLLRALTGIDADRLPEEQRRGMTIDVGYAHLASTTGTELDFVDVPGHDRLVGNMLVGAGEIDAAMLVVAADDGPARQTIEHLDSSTRWRLPTRSSRSPRPTIVPVARAIEVADALGPSSEATFDRGSPDRRRQPGDRPERGADETVLAEMRDRVPRGPGRGLACGAPALRSIGPSRSGARQPS
jgi:hypothetical protein